MGIVSNIRYHLSRLTQSLKKPNQYRKLKAFMLQEKELIRQIHSVSTNNEKKGTLIIKCDDIGDFLIWQQVIPTITARAERPIYFVGNRVVQPLVETYFDFADQYVWIDKIKWEGEDYRLAQYKLIHSMGVKLAFSTLFTRNLKLDDLLLMASAATERVTWDISHHAYFPEITDSDGEISTRTVLSTHKIELEYFRNIEFIKQIYHVDMPGEFKLLFPNFSKQNRLVVVPVASAASKCWKPDNYIAVITNVYTLFDSIILLGGKDGIDTCRQIEKTCSNMRIINLCGETSLPELITCVGESELIICPDTFALHAAVLTGTDVILLTNGTNWQRFTNYSPYISSGFRVLYPPGFKVDHERVKLVYSRSEINSIQPEMVIEAVRSMHVARNL